MFNFYVPIENYSLSDSEMFQVSTNYIFLITDIINNNYNCRSAPIRFCAIRCVLILDIITCKCICSNDFCYFKIIKKF